MCETTLPIKSNVSVMLKSNSKDINTEGEFKVIVCNQ
jgi:hypothetical protein